MKKIIIIIFSTLLIQQIRAQEEPIPNFFKAFSEKSLSLGYTLSSGEDIIKNYHLLKFEYWSSNYENRHNAGICKFIGSEIGLNTEKFLLGPKAGITLSYGPFYLGAETTVYTDFQEGTLRVGPIFGFGNYIMKLHFSHQLKIFNPSFEPINRSQISICI